MPWASTLGGLLGFSALSSLLCHVARTRARAWRTGSGIVNDRLTMIITTSPTKVNPSTKVLEAVLASLVFFEPTLASCRKIIVCDGTVTVPQANKVKYKSGRITAQSQRDYEGYVARLKLLAEHGTGIFHNTTVLHLEKRYGFAFAVKHALELVETPLVMVVQHDRTFERSFDLPNLVKYMGSPARSAGVDYVGLLSNTTLDYATYVHRRYNIDLFPYARSVNQPKDLVPLLFWYDSTHIVRTKYYREFVFGYIQGWRGKFRLRTGDFIEDKLGQSQLNTIKREGMEVHARYATFLYDDGREEPIVFHMDGRDSRIERRVEEIWQLMKDKGEVED